MQPYFLNFLGDAKGFTIGTTIALAAALINVAALAWLERYRQRKQKAESDTSWERKQKQEQDAWERERAARLEELRRQTYTDAVAACEARAFLGNQTERGERREVLSAWRGSRATIRFVTDDRRLIEAADAMVVAADSYRIDPEAFRVARTQFVTLCRAEIGRDTLPMESTPSE